MTEDIVSVQDVKDYLGLFECDELVERRITSLRKTVAEYLNETVGSHVTDDNAIAKELALVVLDDLYSNRAMDTGKVSSATRRIVDSMALVLVLAGRGEDERVSEGV
ncbi:MAG: hypothetical protein RR619_10275 [Raoultibacter sp.]